jgi:hypothetical protein
MKTSGSEQKTQTQICAATAIEVLKKVPKTYTREKTASSTNGAGETGCLPAKDQNSIPVSYPVCNSNKIGDEGNYEDTWWNIIYASTIMCSGYI